MSLFQLWVLAVLTLMALHWCEMLWESWNNTQILYNPPEDERPSFGPPPPPPLTQEQAAAPEHDPEADTWDEIPVYSDGSPTRVRHP